MRNRVSSNTVLLGGGRTSVSLVAGFRSVVPRGVGDVNPYSRMERRKCLRSVDLCSTGSSRIPWGSSV